MSDTKEKRATHTPGPWHAYQSRKNVHRDIASHDGSKIAREVHHANARLIAAAPAMYEVLQEILAPCPTKGYLGKYDRRRTYNARKKAREVLAKVEGGEG